MPTDPLTPKDASREIGVAVSTLHDWRGRGVGPAWYRTDSGHIRYRADDVHNYLDAHGPGPRSVGGRPRTRGCASEAGYRWHRRHGQQPCDPCRDAHRVSQGRAPRAAA